ncbi:MAG: sigma-70 family RNA polymerase sigma factor [Candidatus Acidiferrales bacterium]
MTAGANAESIDSDLALISRVVARDEDALALLYDRYSGLMCAVVTRILRDAAAAEEILQDVFYQLRRTAARFDPARGSLPGWLLVVARNRAISRLRQRGSDRQTDDSSEFLESTLPEPFSMESAVAQRQMMGKVKGALENLSLEQRQAVELAYFEGMTHSEIAQKTGDPLGTVKTRLRSAVELLKRALQS